MTKHEAVEILEEVRTLDDSMFAYSQAYNDALDMAIGALKAQEAVRPGIGIILNDDGSKSYFLHCPLDGTTLDEGDKYCPKCGRAVKWK